MAISKNECIYKWVLLLSLLITTLYGIAQEPPMRHLGKDDGLPSNTVYDIYRDSKGFLWIATDKGIARYNGISMQTFTTSDGLPDNEIFFFQEDAIGRVWLGTYNGELCYYKNDSFHTEANTPFLRLAKKSSFIKYINVQSDSSILIGFESKDYVIRITNNHLDYVDFKEVMQHSHSKKPLSCAGVFLDKGNYKVFREDSLFTTDMKGNLLKSDTLCTVDRNFNSLSVCRAMFGQNVHYFYDRFGIYDSLGKRIWKIGFATNVYRVYRVFAYGKYVFTGLDTGLAVSEAKSGIITDSVIFLNGKNISAITNAVNGDIWLGTLGDGLYIMPRAFDNYKYFNGAYFKEIYFSKSIKSGAYFADGMGQICSIRQNAIKHYSFDLGDNFKIWHPQKPGYLIDSSFRLIQISNGRVQIVNDIRNRNSKTEEFPDKDFGGGFANIFCSGNWLVVHMAQSLIMCDIEKWKKGEDIHNAADGYPAILANSEKIFGSSQRKDGSVWCSTMAHMRCVKDGKVTDVNQFNGVALKKIHWHNDFLLAYTHSNKLLAYHFEGQRLIADTLPTGNCIWDSMYDLDDDHMLVSTNNQYRIINLHAGVKPTLSILNNDFVPLECESICADSIFCYFFKKGTITSIKISELLRANTSPYLLHAGVTVGQRRENTATINVSYNESRNISLQFSTISFDTRQISYQYSVDRGDQGKDVWNNFNSSPLSLVNIGFGDYTVRVRAVTDAGEISALLVYHLSIRRPYWLSWWFISLCSLLIGGIVWYIIRKRTIYIIGRREKEHQSKVRYMKSEYKALNALMNPHFIFNALNNVQGLVNSGDKRSANEYLRIFADLVRQNMHNVSMELIPMVKELELVRNYLLLEKLRFDNKLKYSINIEDDIDTTELLIPPLVIQPLVENAIKHGILPLESGDGEVYIHVFEQDDSYVVEIWDNGVGFAVSASAGKMHQSFGLENLRKRIDYLKQINSMEMELTIEERKRGDAEVRWTVVTVSFR